ncbi:glycosyltransferase family protein [Phaeocystidibacter luteus]|uniref:Glycosyl transferase n=1 Tax=Phaeocystidibacter luteus TaxID=911197 RepID=A0A6N6RLN3_9FLAO|nr:glycosyltransferase family protein [Phaeocystidibacter luteus]KAB2814477.1 glycosyl transferase [Phaeocystidibacter luteus]
MQRTKVLYAIQGTGNGHVSRARALYPKLIEEFDVDLALVGGNSDVDLPSAPVWTGKGISMEYGGDGSVDILKTLVSNNIFKVFREVREIPVEQYDFIINDFESISLRAAKRRKVPVLGLSHQAAVANPKSPKTKKVMPMGKLVLNNYAPVRDSIGFHYQRYANDILLPIIHDDILHAYYMPGDRVVVYLPAYSKAEISEKLSSLPYKFSIFHKSIESEQEMGNIRWNPISGKKFSEELISSKAVVCSAGFELPSECLHHGIPLVVVPIAGQYEQWCNAEALGLMGVPALESLSSSKLENALAKAIAQPVKPQHYPDVRGEVIHQIKSWWERMRK